MPQALSESPEAQPGGISPGQMINQREAGSLKTDCSRKKRK